MPQLIEVVDYLNEDDLEEMDNHDTKEFKEFEITEASLLELKKTLINAEENTRFNNSIAIHINFIQIPR